MSLQRPIPIRSSDSVFACRPNERGLTLVELIVTCFILTILASAALPLLLLSHQ